MSNAVVIRGEGLGKSYRRGLRHSGLLRDTLGRLVRSPFSALRRHRQETFWALKDVSLEVREGEVLGLVGRNGAGKTTLLKVLSRITRPTTGWAEIRGRVGSLLEVGTGFHPELTGRENTFLSGAILGMGKREIQRKFDEIVAFAEMEEFIDTPVKHYSSGMYVRLAFAVAAHLEPEILLVDEVLAVGDIKFQKKCLGKMGDVARAGRTVVLVTHQLNQIRRLCGRVFWIDGGRICRDGTAADVVGAYESAMSSREEMQVAEAHAAASKAHFKGWQIVGSSAEKRHTLDWIGPVTVQFHLDVRQPLTRCEHGVTLYTPDRQIVWGWAAHDLALAPGSHELSYTFPMLPLRPGVYTWMVSLWDDHGKIDMTDVVPEMLVTTQSLQHSRDEWSGILNLPSKFEVSTFSGDGVLQKPRC